METPQYRQIGPARFGRRPRLQQFRRALDLEAVAQGRAPRARPGHHAVRYRRCLWQRGGSEEQLGEILGARRKDIVLATKFGMPMDDDGKSPAPRGAISRGGGSQPASASRPTGSISISCTSPIRRRRSRKRCAPSTISCKPGKVRYIGCSNLPAWQVVDAQWTSRKRKALAHFISAQDEYSLLVRGIEKRTDPGAGSARHGPAAVFPARQRPAHRQIQARRRHSRRHAHGR